MQLMVSGILLFSLALNYGPAEPFTDDIIDHRVIRVSYSVSDELIFNPERGHYVHHTIRDQNAPPILESSLDSIRDFHKISLVLTIYYLGEFMEGPLSDKMLRVIDDNMETLRKSGLKCILRFAYKSNVRNEPWDPSREIVSSHISQLKPVIRKNADVISALEAGFIGVWGEWYYTSSFGYPDSDFDLRGKILEELLDAIPPDRMVCVRTPTFKMRLLGLDLTDYVTEVNAYNQSSSSRVGHHNDCFLASRDDYGTFQDISNEKDYLENDSRFVVVGGETCNPSIYSECPNANEELERFHWSYLNIDYHRGVLNSWKEGNCYEEIVRRLGYRFSLVDGQFDLYSGNERALGISLTLSNDGYAAPYNPRDVEIIMKHESGAEFISTVDSDPRFWLPGEHKIKTLIKFALDAPEGKYSLYLKLAPPEESLYDNPFYCIRLANKDIWDPERGYNLLTTFIL